MDKADRLRTGVGEVSHAMTLVGVDEDQGFLWEIVWSGKFDEYPRW